MLEKLIAKDRNRRLKQESVEIQKKIINFLLKTNKIDYNMKVRLNIFNNKKLKKIGITRINNKCITTGRERGVFKKLRLSRIALKYSVDHGLIFGLNKSSW
jgi:ribosomal protein S14